MRKRFWPMYSNSACQLFRQIIWEFQRDTTYNFYLLCPDDLGFRVEGLGFGVWGF